MILAYQISHCYYLSDKIDNTCLRSWSLTKRTYIHLKTEAKLLFITAEPLRGRHVDIPLTSVLHSPLETGSLLREEQQYWGHRQKLLSSPVGTPQRKG